MPRGKLYKQETREKFADIARYIYIDSTPVNDFKFQEKSQKHAQELIGFIEESLGNADGYIVGYFPNELVMLNF